jgi:hypothetical protein
MKRYRLGTQVRKLLMKLTIPIVCLFFLSVFLGELFAESVQEYQKATDCLTRKGEVYFKFNIENRAMLDSLTRIVSLDNVDGTIVYAYANSKEFARFRKMKIEYEVLTLPGELIKDPKMFDLKKGESKAWDAYPTYESYVALMAQFAAAHPDLCRIVDAGNTVAGRKILFAVISDNVTVDEAEPYIMYTSSIHGDETAGYGMLLHLIDSLLTGYATSNEIRNMVNSTSIWINPLANPDGTYAGGNASVSGATRYNGNNIDINRNFPNPVGGNHPDGESWQPETERMMTLASSRQFTLSANFHGGAELVNYPWDSWTSSVNASPDDLYWQHICREYVDSIHAHSPTDYMIDQNNGITNGGDWYVVYGSRQDYMTYYKHCREVTIEMSHTKLLPTTDLVNFWNYNFRSLFFYIKEASNGFGGVITDNRTGNVISATVSVVGHDRDNSEVISSAILGDYYRPMQAGTFSVEIRAPGYVTRVVPISVNYHQRTLLNASLDQVRTTDKITLTGTLLNSSGVPVGTPSSVTYNVSVRLHTHASTNAQVYKEDFLTANGQGVTISNGGFRIILGKGQTTDNLQSVLASHNNLWVEIVVDNDVLSRIPLTASPFVLTH